MQVYTLKLKFQGREAAQRGLIRVAQSLCIRYALGDFLQTKPRMSEGYLHRKLGVILIRHYGATILYMRKNHNFFVPVNVLTPLAHTRFLGLRNTHLCVLIKSMKFLSDFELSIQDTMSMSTDPNYQSTSCSK